MGDRVVVKHQPGPDFYGGWAGVVTFVGRRRWGGVVETDCSVQFPQGPTLPFPFAHLDAAPE